MISFLQQFIYEYVMKYSSVDVDQSTWFGAPYKCRVGMPKAYTMCRAVPLRKDIKYFLSSEFRTGEGSDTPISVMMAGEGSRKPIDEPIFGLDEELPLQFLQLAIELNIEAGYLPGPPFGDAPVCFGNPVLIRARAHPVCEPGDKVRWVTMEESFVTVALQPLAHWLAGVVGRYKSLVSAFSRTYKAWDACVAMQRNVKTEPNYGFGTFDLTGASNQMSRQFAAIAGMTLICHFNPEGCVRRFLLALLHLMMADREIRVKDRENSKRFRTIICRNGLLMGNPGTKEFLCLESAVLHSMTINRLGDPVYYTLIAGDDVFVLSTKRFFEQLLKNHTEFGNIINLQKSMWSKVCAFYCEEAMHYVSSAFATGRAPWQGDYEKGLHVDVPKLRLLSPFGVQSVEQDPTYTNPAIGKAGALKHVFAWYPRKDVKWVLVRRFLRWMSDFINYDYQKNRSGSDPMVFLPRSLGGWDIPYLGDWEDLYQRIISRVQAGYFSVFSRIRSDEADYHSLIDILLRRMATGNSVRGILDPMSYLMTAQYAALGVYSYHDECKTFTDIEKIFRSRKSWEPRGRDIISFATNELGLIGYHDIVENLDRQSALKVGFVVAAGHVPLRDVMPLRGEDGALPSPSQVLDRFFASEVPTYWRGVVDSSYFACSGDALVSFRTWLTGSREELLLRKKQMFIPREVMVNGLNGMSIPLPYRVPKHPVKGS